MANKVVAVVGMCGAGKSVATSQFVKRGWTRIYFGDVIMNEVLARNLEITEANERFVREDLRKSGDLAIYAKKIEPSIREALKSNNVVVESLYAWSEYKYLKEIYGNNMQVVAIVADHQVRVDRLKIRDFRPLTEQEVKSRDCSQIENLEQGGPIAIADHYIINNACKSSFIKKVNEYIKSFEK